MHKLPACILDGRAFQRPNITNKIYGSIAYGANVRLDCKITGRYSIGWYKGEQPVSYDKLGGTVAILMIKNFNESYDGFYSCKAKRLIVHWTAEDKIYLKAAEGTTVEFAYFWLVF